jgi:hypothetical protein
MRDAGEVIQLLDVSLTSSRSKPPSEGSPAALIDEPPLRIPGG